MGVFSGGAGLLEHYQQNWEAIHLKAEQAARQADRYSQTGTAREADRYGQTGRQVRPYRQISTVRQAYSCGHTGI